MTRLYLISSVLAISFFSYAQYRGMTFYTGSGAQQLRSGGSGNSYSRSSSLSHK